jgi:hypothetical protein
MDMMNLPDDIQEEFMSGKFVIKRTAGVFNGQWSDIATGLLDCARVLRRVS